MTNRFISVAFEPLAAGSEVRRTGGAGRRPACARIQRAVGVLGLVAALLGSAWGAEAPTDLDLAEQEAIRAAVASVAPSVVRIETIGGLERVDGMLFGTGPTTGLVVHADGYLVASAVSFLNKPSSILVQLPDGSRHPARIVATDHNRMIVLLKIDAAQPLPVPEVVPPPQMRVGQWAIAVGRALDASQPNLAVGIVSALGRIWGKAVQTDAAVSPNNYGGPLIDIHGRVLGVLVPLSPQDTREVAGVEWYDSGIGFAVVAHDLWQVLPKLQEGKDLFPGMAGIGLPSRNLYTAEPLVASCRPNSPAYQAGLRQGDRILEISGRPITRASQVKEEISRRYAGETVRVVALRGPQRIECDIPLVAKLPPYEHPFLGVLPRRMVEPAENEAPAGVVVRYVYPHSPAAAAGIQPGDVLVGLAGQPALDAQTFRQKLSDFQPGESVAIELRRDGQRLECSAKLDVLPEALPPQDLPPARQRRETIPDPRPASGTIELKVPESPNEVWAYVPEDYDPAAGYGVVIWLDAPGTPDERELIARWKPLCDRDDLILVVPKPANPDNWQNSEAALLGRVVDEVRMKYRLDAARVVVGGKQRGGTLAFLAGLRLRDRFRAVVSVDGPLAGQAPENEPALRLAFFVAHSAQSPLAGQVANTVRRLREQKFPVTVRDLGEPARDLDAGELDQLARWIDTLDRL